MSRLHPAELEHSVLRLGPHQHTHACACGDFYTCSRRDGCTTTWECPSCEQQRLDDHVEALFAHSHALTHTDAH